MRPHSEAELRELAAQGAAELDGASATELLEWTDANFGGVNGPRGGATCNYVVASNMADAVLVDLAAKVRAGVPVLFLDTGYHFAETIGTRDAVEAMYDIALVNVTPEQTVAEQDAAHGKDLFGSNPALCCLSCARSSRCLARCAATRRGSPGCAGWRRRRVPTPR